MLYVFLLPDIDECRESPGLCDENADCTNTIGSYQCACYLGYSGSGHKCESKSCFFFFSAIAGFHRVQFLTESHAVFTDWQRYPTVCDALAFDAEQTPCN